MLYEVERLLLLANLYKSYNINTIIIKDVFSERHLVFSGFCPINRHYFSIFFTFVDLQKYNGKWEILNIYAVGT